MATQTIKSRPYGERNRVFPVAPQNDWYVACATPEAVESDSGVIVSGKVVKPSAIARNDNFDVNNAGTRLLVAFEYDALLTTLAASPVVRVFGKDKNGRWHVLQTAAGSDEVTLTVALTTDVVQSAGTLKITKPVEFDLDDSAYFVVGVQTAFNASGGGGVLTNSNVLVKVK